MELPAELWQAVMMYLPDSDRRRCRQVSTGFRANAEQSQVWAQTTTFFARVGTIPQMPWRARLIFFVNPAQGALKTSAIFERRKIRLIASDSGRLILQSDDRQLRRELLSQLPLERYFIHHPRHRHGHGAVGPTCGCASLWLNEGKLHVGFIAGRNVDEPLTIRIMTLSSLVGVAIVKRRVLYNYSGPSSCCQGRFVTFGGKWPCFALHERTQEGQEIRFQELSSTAWQCSLLLGEEVAGLPLFIKGVQQDHHFFVAAGYKDGAVRVWTVDADMASGSSRKPSCVIGGLCSAAMGRQRGWCVGHHKSDLCFVGLSAEGALRGTSMNSGQTLFTVDGDGDRFQAVMKRSVGGMPYALTVWEAPDTWRVRMVEFETGHVVHTQCVDRDIAGLVTMNVEQLPLAPVKTSGWKRFLKILHFAKLI